MDHLEQAFLDAQILVTTLKGLRLFLDIFFVKKSKELTLKVVKKNTVVFTDFIVRQEALREAYLTFLRGNFLNMFCSENKVAIKDTPLEELVAKFT